METIKKEKKSDLERRKYWKEKADKLQKENRILKDKLKLAKMELKILGGETRTEQKEQPIKIYGRGIHELI